MTLADQRARAYSALLTADGYAEQARDALRAGDDDAARHAIEVLRGIVAVVTGQLRRSSSENFGTLQ
jgi:predicted dinucleotide-binding enzyme